MIGPSCVVQKSRIACYWACMYRLGENLISWFWPVYIRCCTLESFSVLWRVLSNNDGNLMQYSEENYAAECHLKIAMFEVVKIWQFSGVLFVGWSIGCPIMLRSCSLSSFKHVISNSLNKACLSISLLGTCRPGQFPETQWILKSRMIWAGLSNETMQLKLHC